MMLQMVKDYARAAIAASAPELPPAPVEAFERLELDSFDNLIIGLSSAIARDRIALQRLEQMTATERPFGRSHGTEYAADELAMSLALVRDTRALLVALRPYEATIRAMIAAEPEAAGIPVRMYGEPA